MDEINKVKEVIITKAVELFSAKGYEGVSVNELTEASGITKPTLYYYFGSKEGLYEFVLDSHYSHLNKNIAENVAYQPNPESYNEDIFKTLINVVKAYFSFALENEAFYRISLANMFIPCSSMVFEIVKKYHFVQFELIEGMFQNMAKTHGNLKKKHKTLTWSFIGSINSYISLYFSGVSGLTLGDKTVKELVNQFMHGIYA